MNASKPQHPTFEELLALTVDELPAGRAEEVREHLLDCPECLAQTRELLSFSDEPPTPQQAIGEAEEAAAWQRLQARIGQDPPLKGLPGTKVRVISPLTDRTWNRRTLPGLLAAIFVGAVLGRFWPSARDGGMRTFEPQALQSESSVYRQSGSESPDLLPCPEEGNPFAVVIATSFGNKVPTVVYLRVATAGGKVVHGYRRDKPNDRGVIGVAIPGDSLPNGSYAVLLQRESQDAPIEKYPFRVECQP